MTLLLRKSLFSVSYSSRVSPSTSSSVIQRSDLNLGIVFPRSLDLILSHSEIRFESGIVFLRSLVCRHLNLGIVFLRSLDSRHLNVGIMFLKSLDSTHSLSTATEANFDVSFSRHVSQRFITRNQSVAPSCAPRPQRCTEARKGRRAEQAFVGENLEVYLC